MSYGVPGGGSSNNLAIVQSVLSNAGTGVVNLGTTTSGNTCFLSLCYDPGGGTSPTCTDNKGNSIGAPEVSTAGAGAIALWVIPNIVGGAAHTFTITGVTLGSSTLVAAEVSGALAASYDSAVNATVNDITSPYTLTSGTPAQAFEMVICAMTLQNAGSLTYNYASWTKLQEQGDNNTFFGQSVAYILTSTAAGQPISVTVTGGSGDTRMAMSGIKST